MNLLKHLYLVLNLRIFAIHDKFSSHFDLNYEYRYYILLRLAYFY